MLVAATAIFVYYTVWTLFMVRTLCALQWECKQLLAEAKSASRANLRAALRRRGPRPALALPPPRLGHPHPCDPDRPLHHCCRQLPVCRYDTEQPQEGSQGPAEEGILGDTLPWARAIRGGKGVTSLAYGRRMGDIQSMKTADRQH